MVEHGAVSLLINLRKCVKNEHLFRLGNMLPVR